MTSSDTLPLSEDQQALQDTLRGFLGGQLPPAALRAALETRGGYSPELHARLASEFGLTGLTIPREFGGRGLSQVEASVVHSELGRALYPGPLLATTLAGGMLLATGDRVARERWLPLLADGSVIATVAASRRERPLGARPGQRPRRTSTRGLAALRPPLVRPGRPRGRRRRGAGCDRVRPPRCSWRIPGHWVAPSPASWAWT